MVARALILGALLLAACAAPTPAPITLRLATTDVTAALAHDLISAYRAVNPQTQIFVDVLTPQVISDTRPLYDLTLVVSPRSADAATPIGYVRFVVGVNEANPVRPLSADELRAIYTGQQIRWNVDAADKPLIDLAGREENSDAAQSFGTEILRGASLTNNTRLISDWSAMNQFIRANPNAIGYLPAHEATGVKPLFEWHALIVATDVSDAARAFVAWAQSDGQAVVAERYEAYRK